MDCVKKASFLYLQLLRYDSIIPIKVIPDRRLSFPGFSMIWPSLCQPPLPRHFCFHAPQYHSTKQATKWAGNAFSKEWPCSVGEPRGVPEWGHRRPEDADPTLGTLEVDSGVENRCPLDACSAVIWPHPTGQLSASQRTFVLTRNRALLWEVRLVWKEQFIKRSIGNLLGKLWTCWMCMLQVLPQIYFLIFL